MKYNEYFKYWELNHLAKRSYQFGLAEEKTIQEYADKLHEKGSLNEVQKDKLDQELAKVAKINKFGVSCRRKDCAICSRLENLYKLELINNGIAIEKLNQNENIKWKLNLELWRWQKICKNLWWKNNSEGIVKVITGAGKTIFALSLISQLKDMGIYDDYRLKIIVIVPSTTLLEQWKNEFIEKLNLSEEEIGLYYGKEKDELVKKDVMIYVVNSARRKLSKHLAKAKNDIKFDTFLIADECHRYGSVQNSKIFNNNFTYKLGLSATPERQGDYGFENVLIPNLGEVIYRYGYESALEDGVISSYQLFRVSIELTEDEKIEYRKMSDKASKMFLSLKNKYPQLESGNVIKKLGQLQKETGDKALSNYTILLNRRKSIVHESKNRFKAVKWIFSNKINYEDKVLIFHERIEYADEIYNYLLNKDYDVGIFHSKVQGNQELILDKFRNGDFNILVTCKALDEGFDLPKIDTGIIVSATSSIRQRIQRIGRILRRAQGKYSSSIYTIYVKDIEDRIFNTFEMKDMKGAAEEIKHFHLKFNN
ncbi:MAG: DEAD/DEAH box helicase [bacterium]